MTKIVKVIMLIAVLFTKNYIAVCSHSKNSKNVKRIGDCLCLTVGIGSLLYYTIMCLNFSIQIRRYKITSLNTIPGCPY